MVKGVEEEERKREEEGKGDKLTELGDRACLELQGSTVVASARSSQVKKGRL